MKKKLHIKIILLSAALMTVAGTFMTYAATPTHSVEAESGTRTTNATLVSDASASGGQAIKFVAGGGFQANCINAPSNCGYPDATNTGVPAGVTLTNSGSVTVNTNGAVVQNLNIANGGQIVVNANNVTIRNVRLSGCTYYPIDYASGRTGLVIEDTEIASNCPQTTACMSFANYTARRVKCSGGADGFKANSNVTIEDSYIYGLAVSEGSHNDGIQSTGGSNVTVRHNTIDTNTAGVAIQLGSADSNWLVTENLIRATGWAINGGGNLTNSTFTNNRFYRMPGWYGPASLGGSGNTWSGNYYDDDGSPA